MNLRSFAFILIAAGVQVALYLWCISSYMDASDGMPVLGVSGYAIAPFLHVAWVVLLVPFGLLYLLLPHSYAAAAWFLPCFIADALLWGWCAHLIFHFVRRRHQARPST